MPSERFINATIRIEHHLLLLLARTRSVSDDACATVVRIIDEPTFDWDFLIAAATEHGVMIMVYAQLRRIVPNKITPALRDKIQLMVTRSALHNLELTRELLSLQTQLSAQNIKMMPYKGLSLATLAYGGVGMRQFSDIDMLVSPADLRRSKDLIVTTGYYPVVSAEHRAYQKEDEDRSYQGYDLVRNDHRVVIDLQERFGVRFSSFSLTFDEMWERRQQITLGAQQVATLSYEDYLLVLCAHGTQHRWQRLKWVCDISELVQNAPQLDWQDVFRRAHTMQTERMLMVGLLIAHESLDLPLPDSVLARIQADDTTQRLALYVYQWMFREVNGFKDLVIRAIFDYSFDLKMRPQLKNKVSCALFLTRRRLLPREHDVE